MLSDRKLKTSYIDARELIPDPDNVNTHSPRNEEAVRKSMLQFGVRSPIVAHEKTKIVYKGNLSLQIFLELAEQGKTEGYEIPVSWIPEDTDNLVARAYGIADNRSSELSQWDLLGLGELVEEIQLSELNIEIQDMGFDVSELNRLLGVNTDDENDDGVDYDKIWDGMPEFDQKDISGFKIIAHFETVEDIAEFSELIGQKLTEATVFFWYPHKEREDVKAKNYEDES